MSETLKQKLFDFINHIDYTWIPAIPIIAGNHAAFLSKIDFKEVFYSGNILGKVLENAFLYYNHDLVTVFSDVFLEAEAMGASVKFSGNGSFYLDSLPEERDIVTENPEKSGRIPEILTASEYCVKTIGHDVQVCVTVKDPFSLACMLKGPDLFLKDCLKNPESNRQLLVKALENQIRFADAVVRTGALPMIGAPFSSGSVISPKMFMEYSFPYFKSLVDSIRGKGLPVFMHICGNTEIIFDEVKKLEPDVLSIEKLDIKKYAGILNGKSVLMGNFSTEFIQKGTVEEVYDNTASLLNSSPYPFLPATACDIPEKTPPENVKAFIQAVRDCRTKGVKCSF